MLNRVCIDAAAPVALKISENNVRLLPKENTPMMSLALSISRTGLDFQLAENSDIAAIVSQRSQDDTHRAVMTDTVNLATQCVGRVIDNARNIVLPHVHEIVKKVEASVEGRRLVATSPYEVVMKEIPAVYTNQGIFNLAERYPSDGLSYPPARQLAVMDLDKIQQIAKTGMDGVDEDLDRLLSLNNNEGYATVLDVLAGRKAFGDIDFDYAPGVMVIAQAIYDEPTEGLEIGLNDYNTAVNALIYAAAAMTRARTEQYRRSRELGTLYVPNQTSITQVVVMGEAYRKLLDAGLSPEALIGNEMSGRRYSAGQLTENKDQLEAIYNREMNLRALKTQGEMFVITRNAIDQVLRSDIGMTDMEGADKALLMARVKSCVDSLTEHHCSNLYRAVVHLVCAVFYPETDANKYIAILNQVGEQFGPDADAREVALLATIKYVNVWIASQLVVAQA